MSEAPQPQHESELPPPVEREEFEPQLISGEEEPIPPIIYLETGTHNNERTILRDILSGLLDKIQNAPTRTGDRILDLSEYCHYRLLSEMFETGQVVVKPARITVVKRFRKTHDQEEMEETFDTTCRFVMHPSGKQGQEALDDINQAARDKAAAEQPPELDQPQQ